MGPKPIVKLHSIKASYLWAVPTADITSNNNLMLVPFDLLWVIGQF